MIDARNRVYQELRDGAVPIVLQTGKPIAQVAREPSVNAGTLATASAELRFG